MEAQGLSGWLHELVSLADIHLDPGYQVRCPKSRKHTDLLLRGICHQTHTCDTCVHKPTCILCLLLRPIIIVPLRVSGSDLLSRLYRLCLRLKVKRLEGFQDSVLPP